MEALPSSPLPLGGGLEAPEDTPTLSSSEITRCPTISWSLLVWSWGGSRASLSGETSFPSRHRGRLGVGEQADPPKAPVHLDWSPELPPPCGD